MTVADKLCIEDGRAPRAPGCSGGGRRRMRRAHDPARFRGRRRRLSRDPQQKRGDAGGLRSQRQLAACHKIELPRLAPDFQHHGTQGIAGERVSGAAQCALAIFRTHRHQTARIEPELRQSAHRQRARFDIGKILPHPHQRPACSYSSGKYSSGKTCDETGCRRALMSLGKHLMHRGPREPAAQHRIGFRMAERHALESMQIAMRFDAFDIAAQSRKRVHACAGRHMRRFPRVVVAALI
jgi:hypothetical protein